MTLPEGFIFSQSSLQDYVDCQRRFQLRHMIHLAWPAVEAEPYLENERRIDQGARFHKIARQYLMGIPETPISQSIGADQAMRTWWEHFLTSARTGTLAKVLEPGSRRFEEITLAVPIDKFRLIAKFDLLVIQPDTSLTIVDWKTSENHPKRRWLAERLQTHVYPFVLVGALPVLMGGERIDPAKVQMIYWFPNFPDQPEQFAYNEREYQQDVRFLTNLVQTIDQKTEDVFPLTADVRRCLFCTYRSLCNRGVTPGDVQQLEEWQEIPSADEVSIDMDQIGEIDL